MEHGASTPEHLHSTFGNEFPPKQSKLLQHNDQYFYLHTLALKLQFIFNKSVSCQQRLKISRNKKKRKIKEKKKML